MAMTLHVRYVRPLKHGWQDPMLVFSVDVVGVEPTMFYPVGRALQARVAQPTATLHPYYVPKEKPLSSFISH
jgi:hypothetical protein